MDAPRRRSSVAAVIAAQEQKRLVALCLQYGPWPDDLDIGPAPTGPWMERLAEIGSQERATAVREHWHAVGRGTASPLPVLRWWMSVVGPPHGAALPPNEGFRTHPKRPASTRPGSDGKGRRVSFAAWDGLHPGIDPFSRGALTRDDYYALYYPEDAP